MYLNDKLVRVDGRLPRIARLDADKYLYLDTGPSIICQIHNAGLDADLFTFLPAIEDAEPTLSVPFEPDNLAVLAVTTFDDWWSKTINNKTRNMLRRAEKLGVTVSDGPLDDAFVAGVWRVYNETDVRQGKPFSHYGKDLATIQSMTATYQDTSIFLAAHVDGEFAGFVKLVVDQKHRQAGLMHIVSMIKHRDKAPTNALLAHAVRVCAERNISHLVYSNFAYGNKSRDGLSDFKTHHGFKRHDLPRYYIPLTLAGRAALALGLHRPIKERVPEVLAARFRDTRSAWRRWRSTPARAATRI